MDVGWKSDESLMDVEWKFDKSLTNIRQKFNKNPMDVRPKFDKSPINVQRCGGQRLRRTTLWSDHELYNDGGQQRNERHTLTRNAAISNV